MPDDLTVLAEHRDALLLAEVAAWLHMLGKFHEDFLSGERELATELPSDLVTRNSALDRLLRDNWPGAIWATLPASELGAADLSLFSLIEHHAKQNAPTGFLRLMADAHGRGSGIEKGALNRFAPGQESAVYLASAVGSEGGTPINLEKLSVQRQTLYDFLTEQLTQLRDHNADVNWGTFRPTFVQRLVEDFSASVAETRRPLNDVTLFDQTAASVALFKASLAQVLLNGWKDPTAKLVTDKYRWRILRIGLDGLAFWGQAARASDMRARKELVAGALDAAQRLLEETYPLGMEIYRDENGSAFIVPDVENLLDLAADGASLRDCLQAIATKRLTGETNFDVQLSDATRNTLLFGKLVSEPPAPPAPSPIELAKVWEGVKDRDVCPVCGLRPQGPGKKALERKVCDICERRRLDRAEEWIGKLNTTIWIDEAADASGKVALIAGRFGLERWLSGEALSTVLAFEPSKRTLTDEDRNNKSYPFEYAEFLNQAASALSPRESKQTFGGRTPLLDNLLLTNARGGYTRFTDIYDLYVSDTDLDEPKAREAWRFALALMRQQPAFARIRRIWETTQGFWEDVMTQLGEGQLPTVPLVGPRLRIPLTSAPELVANHAYELRIGDVRMAVARTAEALISIDNLQRVARLLGAKQKDSATPAGAADFVKARLRQVASCPVVEPGEYSKSSQALSTVSTMETDFENTPYAPVIPILAEPRSFMALVPADRAFDVAAAIRGKYECEFGKVRNRLPLHLGIVFADARQPLRALLDAGRRMLAYQGRPADETWRVAEVEKVGKEGDKEAVVRLERDTEGRALTWRVPLKMGDGKTDDNWYPYVFVATDSDDEKGPGRTRQFKGPRPTGKAKSELTWLVHAGELEPGDQVYFTPATLDVQWLDAAAGRFEVAYDGQGRRLRREWGRTAVRPYLLDDLATFQTLACVLGKKLPSASQRYALRDVIEGKREDWQPQGAELGGGGAFWQFCRDAIVTAEWRGMTPIRLDEWADHATRGTLTDVINLYARLDLFETQSEKEASRD